LTPLCRKETPNPDQLYKGSQEKNTSPVAGYTSRIVETAFGCPLRY
jgi:hypothetical protein